MQRFAPLLIFVAAITIALAVHRSAAQSDENAAPDEAASTVETTADPTATPDETGDATTAEASEAAPPSAAEAAMQDLKDRRAANPLIEPAVKPATGAIAGSVETSGLDPRVIGRGPGARPAPLRREGEFLIDRRGRLVRAPRTGHMMFHFDADEHGSPEMPMILLPCRLLENMEDLVAERGDRIVFKVTGQVFVYRGANYVLPTLFTLALDKGNLQQ